MPAMSNWREFVTIDRVARLAIAVHIGLIAMAVKTWPAYETSPDWILWRSLSTALNEGLLYQTGTEAPFVWSPVAAWFMALVPSIFLPWLVLHLGAVFLLRDWRMIALVFLSWGFWTSTASGAPFIFVFVAGVLAFRGSRIAAVVFLALTLLMPRPVQLPLALWLLWRMPTIRWSFAGLLVVQSAAVLASGYAFDWIAGMADHALPAGGNWGPSALVGLSWLAVGIPLGAWLAWRGKIGLAGLALSPYWLPEYLMMALIDLVPLAWPNAPQPAASEEVSSPVGRPAPAEA